MRTAEDLRKDAAEERPVVLTARDRELFVHLAISRYLTVDQISELVFPGKTASIAPRRLRRLAAGKHQYILRLPFRTKDGGIAAAWTLKPLGYLAAQNAFASIPEPPTHDPPGANFLEHDVLLNQLYVALALATRRKKVSFDRWPFRWLPSDSARLPWTEFDRQANSPTSRLICPDATVELTSAKRRVFIELETGTHTLGFNRDGVGAGRNATRTKIDRYTRFMSAPAASSGATAYAETFVDGWSAELLFVVPTSPRRNAINDYVKTSWRFVHDSAQFDVRALTFDEAANELCRGAQLPPGSPTPMPRQAPAVGLTGAEARAVYDFYNAAIGAIAAIRQYAKGHPQFAAHLPIPDYPANHELVKQLCLRLGGLPR
jgi:hypothetical protein